MTEPASLLLRDLLLTLRPADMRLAPIITELRLVVEKKEASRGPRL
ncbi:MAG TPA: hypothetical protein VGQ86_10640 [Candidatus Limnocylindria bacterium]|nr:hypothetical protein [Candidatus Limnocylindria bacterium]